MHQQTQPRDKETSVGGRFDKGIPYWKRGLDLAVIVLCAPALVVVGGLVAIVIKAGSKGPVLFRQRRVGHRGQQFTCLKFRTMHVNAETKTHQGYTAHLIKSEAPMTKLDASNDPRIIPFGSILRATGLDELPQVLNVIRGDMSLVGPRPCIPYEYEMYEPWQRQRFNAPPGLTGLWQVSGKNRTTFTQMINLDIEYSERASLGLDLKIMFKTFPALVIQCLDQRASLARRKERPENGSAPAAVAKPVRPLHV
ncbi:MAG TPA: sugar transferase [Verrucomicrobiae bacterium]|nr:sugar transferase [Verrucomicrobiae bacterium]